jgi:hypothetical protein
MKAFWQFLGALWPDDDTTANLPAEAAAGTYVPVLNTTTRVVTWEESAAGADFDSILTDDVTGEILVDEDTGNVLTDG